MSPYGEIWNFTRERLAQAYTDLTDEQLRWRPEPGVHNIGEWIYHVAGVECWFASKMTGLAASENLDKMAQAARAGFITEGEFPYSDADMTVAALTQALNDSAAMIRPVMESPTQEQLTMPVETVIGPVVEGVGCLWRVAQHSAYHTGQIWVYRFDSRFPS